MKLFLLFAIAAGSMQSSVQADPLKPEAARRMLDNGNEIFTARMFSEVVAQNPGKNVVMSAYSVLTPLAQLMLATPQDSVTHSELMNTISMPGDEVTKTAFAAAREDLKLVKGITLTSASRLYVAEDVKVNPKYEEMSRNVFGSEVKNINFAQSEAAAKLMNAWVASETNNRIKDLVSPASLDKNTRAILVNALYFKGQWQNRFEVKNTKDLDFHVSSRNTIKVPTMFQQNHMKYGESNELNAKLLEIPYVGSASLLIILPNDIDGLPALEEKLKSSEALTLAKKNMYTADVQLYLPKFKIETTIDLANVLKRLGVNALFTPGQAQLTKLFDKGDDLFVSSAIQKAFIEVNEAGTEAAAANAFNVALSMNISPHYIEKEFRVDHPFYFAVEVKATYTLFNGAVRELTGSNPSRVFELSFMIHE